jgi:hypothetical protein
LKCGTSSDRRATVFPHCHCPVHCERYPQKPVMHIIRRARDQCDHEGTPSHGVRFAPDTGLGALALVLEVETSICSVVMKTLLLKQRVLVLTKSPDNMLVFGQMSSGCWRCSSHSSTVWQMLITRATNRS